MKAMAGTLLTVVLIINLNGCGSNITGTNAMLDITHSSAHDCTANACHPAFGAAGTVFANSDSGTPVSGMQVDAINTADNSRIVIGTTDALGNFRNNTSLSGSFQMLVGNRQSGAYLHKLPADKGCNSCHKWPGPDGGAAGRLY